MRNIKKENYNALTVIRKINTREYYYEFKFYLVNNFERIYKIKFQRFHQITKGKFLAKLIRSCWILSRKLRSFVRKKTITYVHKLDIEGHFV